MMTYNNGTCALQFPSNYVALTEEEMTYIEGGGISCKVLSGIIDGAIILASIGLGGIAHFFSTGGKRVLVKNWTKVVGAVSKVLQKYGSFSMASAILRAVNSGDYWLNFTTVGGIFAYGVDLFDSNRRNEIAFG